MKKKLKINQNNVVFHIRQADIRYFCKSCEYLVSCELFVLYRVVQIDGRIIQEWKVPNK